MYTGMSLGVRAESGDPLQLSSFIAVYSLI